MARFKPLLEEVRSNRGERASTSRLKYVEELRNMSGRMRELSGGRELEQERATKWVSFSDVVQLQADIVGSRKSGSLHTRIIPGVALSDNINQKIHSSRGGPIARRWTQIYHGHNQPTAAKTAAAGKTQHRVASRYI
jgi:hypothetical protein